MSKTPLSIKRAIALDIMPGSGNRGIRERLIEALSLPDGTITFSHEILQRLYPLCNRHGLQITLTLNKNIDGWQVIQIEEGDTTSIHYGLAVDLGSTSVAISLVDLHRGKTIDTLTSANRQIQYGDDILTRIFYTKDSQDKLKQLQESTVETIEGIKKTLQTKHAIKSEHINVMLVSGNTTMLHFLVGISPWPLFHTPYIPVFCIHEPMDARFLGFTEACTVYFSPSVANYLGGDAVSGVIHSGLSKREAIGLFIDIGTNGEMIIGNDTFLIAAAGAAGPALENGISAYGMRAEAGAVDTVRIVDNKIHMTTIDNAIPKGICGSGIVDLLAEMLVHGLIDMSGHFNPNQSKAVTKTKEGYGVTYAVNEAGEPLIFTEKDIEGFMDTKAAAATMIDYLLEVSGLVLEDIDSLYLAGGFGTHLNIENAIAIGMYPDVPREKLHALGNASLKGAEKMLLDSKALVDAQILIEKIYYLELGEAKDFLTKMYASKFLPHTDLSRYPSVVKRMEEVRKSKKEK